MSESKARISHDRQATSANGRRFADDFKRDAVRLVVEVEYTFKAAAKAVGVSEKSLRDWHKRLAPPPRPCGEDATLDELRAENKLDRDFTADAPNRKWVTDTTYLRIATGWVYLAVVIDLFSRKAVGWSISTSLAAELVSDALRQAIENRRPDGKQLLHHSDRGGQSIRLVRSWKRCGQLAGLISLANFNSREATRHVSHNNDASVG